MSTAQDPGWQAAYLKTLGGALALIILILGAIDLADRIDRATDESIRARADRANYRQWVADACTPGDVRETAIVKLDGKRLECRLYANAERGMAPRLVSAAVADVPQ